MRRGIHCRHSGVEIKAGDFNNLLGRYAIIPRFSNACGEPSPSMRVFMPDHTGPADAFSPATHLSFSRRSCRRRVGRLAVCLNGDKHRWQQIVQKPHSTEQRSALRSFRWVCLSSGSFCSRRLSVSRGLSGGCGLRGGSSVSHFPLLPITSAEMPSTCHGWPLSTPPSWSSPNRGMARSGTETPCASKTYSHHVTSIS